MRLFFVQHGQCLAKDINEHRPLSEVGRQESEKVAQFLNRSGIMVDRVYHSGKLRARETAEIFAETLRVGTILEYDCMNPNDEVTPLTDSLSEPNTMYVGHLPYMEKLVSGLCSGNEASGIIRFRNSGVVCLERTGDGYQIQWFVIPEIC